ncbi:uncharacterized protein Z520_02412 [Fonsecaea multimorphosa CBS 102226]|uniref:RING-type domain-containing protein n=1 Tax=Fonsecaea multimorphosa CBS 102226 TaxID=1442371 RepID=A0A0D2KZV0_9EURO|nr:uncharacterized protein Z520_02412 [Fonsecaea multimorphosa CBS 102226]KIY02274.1 hypothetical protein Z520_02412 [Fonsecaea multimorphosa CBS 102226]OAL28922.1 hypothetical protein AYO22_02358 [Fonsecaea multimorphosa]
MDKEAETKLVYSALTLTSHYIEDQYNDTASKLPQNGKAVSNIEDNDDNEQKVLPRVKAIDTRMESCGQKRQSANTLSLSSNLPPASHLGDDEPYIKPIAGHRLTPGCPHKLGSSCRIHDTPSALNGSQAFGVEDTYGRLDGLPEYPRSPFLIEPTKHHNLNRSPPSLKTEFPDNRRTTKSMSFGSTGAGPPLHYTPSTENRWQGSPDGKGIERSLQKVEEASGPRGWNRPSNNRNVVSKVEHDTEARVMTEAQPAEDKIDRQDQEEIEALIEPIRMLQGKWNWEEDLSVRQEQEMARPSAAHQRRKEKEKTREDMRRVHAQLQAKDNPQLEEDLSLPCALFSETGDEARGLPEWQVHQPPARAEESFHPEIPSPLTRLEAHESPALPRRQSRRRGSFRWFKSALRLAVNQLPTSVSAAIPGKRAGALGGSDSTRYVRENLEKRSPPAEDRDTISATLNVASNAHEEAGRKARRARRGMEHRRREETQHRQAVQSGQEDQRRTRSASTAECSACVEPVPRNQMCRLECKHYYCRPCLETAIRTAVKDKKTFRCCSRPISPDLVSQWLPARVLAAYAAVVEELATPNPTYCHSWRCSAFIPPAFYVGDDVARCPRCSSTTCRLCKQKAHHAGVVCAQDAAGQALLGLSLWRKWMRCPHCRTMVERCAGCLHMTCTCGTQFCYNCGKPSWRCRNGKCTRR